MNGLDLFSGYGGISRDIGKLLKEVQTDIRGECEAEIKEQLYRWALPHITRVAIRGLPEWYKEQLVAKQFESETAQKGDDGGAA